MAKTTEKTWERCYDTCGTSLQGYIRGIKHSELKKVLGQGDGAGDKTKDEWGIIDTVSDVKATIYDWKNFGIPVSKITTWHIGGVDGRAVELVKKIFPNANITKGY